MKRLVFIFAILNIGFMVAVFGWRPTKPMTIRLEMVSPLRFSPAIYIGHPVIQIEDNEYRRIVYIKKPNDYSGLTLRCISVDAIKGLIQPDYSDDECKKPQ